MVAGAGADQQPADHPTPTKAGQAKTKARAKPRAEAAVPDDRPAVIRAAAKVVRAVTGAAGWLADLWRQADQQATPPKGEAIAASPPSPSPVLRSLWRSP